MILRKANGRVDGILATRLKLRLMRSSCRTRTETVRLAATASRTPTDRTSKAIKSESTTRLMANVMAKSIRYAVSQRKQNRRRPLGRAFGRVEPSGCDSSSFVLHC
jgi:hypothetical protein